ncbi:hypothetical protein DFH11DRAFT_464688 [Phellopilus nigrolimitatus]|nr:hypothetical protein DFH11DRAFT_464688 [Phellopilus nigrolimitatus]
MPAFDCFSHIYLIFICTSACTAFTVPTCITDCRSIMIVYCKLAFILAHMRVAVLDSTPFYSLRTSQIYQCIPVVRGITGYRHAAERRRSPSLAIRIE